MYIFYFKFFFVLICADNRSVFGQAEMDKPSASNMTTNAANLQYISPGSRTPPSNRAASAPHVEATAPIYQTQSWAPAATVYQNQGPPPILYHKQAPGPAQPSLYPALGHQAAPDIGLNAVQYRLEYLTKLRQDLIDEKMLRRRLYKKCKRWYNWLDHSGTGLSTLALTLGGGGIAAAVSVLGIPVAIGLGAGTAFSQVLSVACHVAKRIPARGVKKHDALYTLTIAKLDSISSQISQALDDGSISQVEFDHIIREIQQYYQSRAEIRGKPRDDDVADKDVLKKAGEEFDARILKLIGTSKSTA